MRFTNAQTAEFPVLPPLISSIQVSYVSVNVLIVIRTVNIYILLRVFLLISLMINFKFVTIIKFNRIFPFPVHNHKLISHN